MSAIYAGLESPEISWDDLRYEMPVTRKWAYFDHAAVAPITRSAHGAMLHWTDQALAEGDVVWPAWNAQAEEARSLTARLINAQEEEIALVRNTTAGIALVADGFPWKSGDNVVTLANEFPSNLYPWMNLASLGVECRRVEAPDGRVDLDALAAACDQRTRIVTVSWVGYASGFRVDVDEIAQLAHERGALLFLDAIQGLGVFPLDVAQTPVDFLSADGHKWLLGPEGAGVFYCRQEHLDTLRPLGVGWNSVKHSADFTHVELDLKDSAERYEGGSQNMVGFIGLAASLKCLMHYGPARIATRLLEVTDELCEQLKSADATIHSSREPRHASGIVSFSIPGSDLAAVKREAIEHGIVLSYRGGRLRASPHAYTDSDDIERLAMFIRTS